jgi:hypothetical protein
MKLNIKALALTCGILWGLSVFLITLISLWHGHGGHLGLLSLIYVGYTVSYAGSVIGLVYGFVDGLISGALFAWLYNRLAG